MREREVLARPSGDPVGLAAHGLFGTTFAALAVPDFRYLWLGNFASQVGVWLQTVALGWVAYSLTDSGTFLGAVGLARALPSLLLTLPAGVIADRWDRRRILLLSQLGSMLNAVALAWLVASGTVQPWHILATGILGGITQSFNMPARQSLAPELAGARHLANAVALNAISFNTARVLGPALAGIFIGLWGLASCFVAQAAGFAWAVAWTVAIADRDAGRGQRPSGSLWGNLVDGLRYVKGSPAVVGLLAISAVPIALGMIYLQLMPIVARDVLSVGASGMGLLMTAVGMGSLVGSFVAAALSHHPGKGIIQVVGGVALGGAIGLFAVSHWLTLSLVSLALVGVAQAIVQAINQTLLNIITPNEYRGRVMSVYLMTWNLAPMVWLPAGWLADVAGAPFAILLSGLLVSTTTLLIGARDREIRQMR